MGLWCKYIVGRDVFINKDTLFVKQDRIPDYGCSDILESKSAEVELSLANAVHQLDA